jgi:hypothetical protein
MSPSKRALYLIQYRINVASNESLTQKQKSGLSQFLNKLEKFCEDK